MHVFVFVFVFVFDSAGLFGESIHRTAEQEETWEADLNQYRPFPSEPYCDELLEPDIFD